MSLKTTRGVRILKETHFASDTRRATEVFCEMKQAEKEDEYGITPVDESPLCEKVADYYQTAARTTMARLFTRYLDKIEMTPFELLHCHKNLKRLLNVDAMVPTAVDKIASLHARVSTEDARKRKDIIYQAVDRIAQRAREVDSKELPELKGSTLDELLRRIDARHTDAEERSYLTNVPFVRATINWTGWLGKLAELVPMAKSQKDERARAMVDEMLADIFMAKTIIKDVIGVSKHLGDAIMRILDLLEGKRQPTKLAVDELVQLLNQLFATDMLPRSKRVLFDWLERDLAGAGRLTNSEAVADDKEFFDTIVARLVTDRGIIGGRALAVGLTDRWARLTNVGGAMGRKRAMEGVRDKLVSGKRKFIYLLAMYDPKADAATNALIENQVRDFPGQLNAIQKIAPEARTEKTRLQEVAAIQQLVLDSELPTRFGIRHRPSSIASYRNTSSHKASLSASTIRS